jgi:hypothetical protein
MIEEKKEIAGPAGTTTIITGYDTKTLTRKEIKRFVKNVKRRKTRDTDSGPETAGPWV